MTANLILPSWGLAFVAVRLVLTAAPPTSLAVRLWQYRLSDERATEVDTVPDRGIRALICGDREWNDRSIIEVLINGLDRMAGKTPLTIIHGAARGADALAGRVASEFDVTIESYPADWDRLGKRAGVLRNEQMLQHGRPNVVFAFHDNLAESKGTKDMVARARKADIPVYVIARAM